MRRLIVLLSLLVLPGIACTFEFQTMPQGETETPTVSPVPATEGGVSGNAQDLEGPDINYNGIRFTLNPALGSHLYAFEDAITIDGLTTRNTRLSVTTEEYCQTWCLNIYHVAEFEQAFGSFSFPPQRSAVVFKAQEKALSFQNGSGDRSLETFGQNHYGVSNESLKYVFRGYTADKQYAVYVQIPIRTASLPDVAPTMTTDSDPTQDILQYNQQAAQSLNALAPADFTPNLDLLDALVASIQVGTP